MFSKWCPGYRFVFAIISPWLWIHPLDTPVGVAPHSRLWGKIEWTALRGNGWIKLSYSRISCYSQPRNHATKCLQVDQMFYQPQDHKEELSHNLSQYSNVFIFWQIQNCRAPLALWAFGPLKSSYLHDQFRDFEEVVVAKLRGSKSKISQLVFRIRFTKKCFSWFQRLFLRNVDKWGEGDI